MRDDNTGTVFSFRPPAALLEITRALESRGFEAWAVGGALRDELLGDDGVRHQDSDWDVATNARPPDVRRVFRRTVPLGIEHGTVGVLASDGDMYEVTTFRRDVETDGRHAVVEFADSIEEDLARRDFTINALAWRPATDDLRDPFAGQVDMRRGVLRAVGEAVERFAEDYLRVLRGLRFAGRFSLEIEPATRTALEEAAAHLQRLSAERVRDELAKVLANSRPSAALHLYAEAGALTEWYPELASVATDDPRWELNLAAIDVIGAERYLLRLARWLIPLSDDPEEREALGRALMTRLKFSTAETRSVADRLRHYPILLSPVDSSAEARRWLADVGTAVAWDLFRLHAAECRAANASEQSRFLVAVWRKVHDEWLESPPLRVGDLAISGEDLLALGVGQGPAIGILLDELHAETLEDPSLNRREVLIERARELITVGGLGDMGSEWPGELT